MFLLLLKVVVVGVLVIKSVPGWPEVESREAEVARREERWLQMKGFWQRVGFNGRTKQFTPPYSEAQVTLLIEELRAPDVAMRVVALDLLAYMLRQGAVPAEVREGRLKPLMTELSGGPLRVENEEAARVTEHAQQVLWHLKVHEVPDGPERREFLLGYIVHRRPLDYYAFESMRYLVAMESEEAKATLTEALEQARTRLIIAGTIVSIEGDSHTLRRLQHSITKLDILFSLRGLNTAAQVARLQEAIQHHKDDYFLGEMGDDILVVWLMRRLAALEHPAVIPFLRALWQDQSYDYAYRDEARDLLEQLHALRPEELQVPRIR